MKKPGNLAVVVMIDSEHYGETGMQQTHTSAGVDLAGSPRLAGFEQTTIVRDEASLDRVLPMLYEGHGQSWPC